ncbi:hypothetical protein BJ165DRAFT_1409372 [Panaeolus papilionaceus]|nr:hypothetical protein BJ165DRAFT_1409372 [Panaeolus papilionaceus]
MNDITLQSTTVLQVATERPQYALHEQELPITTTDVQPATVSVTGVPMQEHGNPNEENEHITLDPSHDIVNHVAMFFGYTPILNKELSNSEIGWKNCIKVIGCCASESGQMVGNDNQDDLNPRNRNFLAALYPIQEKVVRVNSRLLILQNRDHTLMTLTEPLLQMQVPFRTLLLFPDADTSLRQHESVIRDVSQYLYPSDYEFTTVDFEDYTTLVQEFLSRPHGRAALLQGGLVARIASRYLGFDTVADGPSSEVRLHLVGDVLKSGQEGFKYMDDCLEDQDIEILIGAYHMKTKQANQTTVVSWLPPPSAFYEQTKVNYWTYWSPGDDEILELVYDDIYTGKGKPKSKRDWRKWVRGRRGPGAAASTSIFYNNLVERSENFMCSVFGIDSED